MLSTARWVAANIASLPRCWPCQRLPTASALQPSFTHPAATSRPLCSSRCCSAASPVSASSTALRVSTLSLGSSCRRESRGGEHGAVGRRRWRRVPRKRRDGRNTTDQAAIIPPVSLWSVRAVQAAQNAGQLSLTSTMTTPSVSATVTVICMVSVCCIKGCWCAGGSWRRARSALAAGLL